jgi:amidase
MAAQYSARRIRYLGGSANGSVPIMDLNIPTATAAELTQALRDRQISSRELLGYLLARAAELNPELNAIVAWDTDRAQAAAAAADEAAARGEFAGPLHGLPMTVKDTYETQGLVTTAGSPDLATYVPQADAVAVARLRAAGAIIFGKTNTPLFAGDIQTYNDVYGRTNNPWDTTRTAGGSSGGAAAALAAGLTPMEFGSDIGGSIRNPAHYNGVFGLKPSWGIVPVRGHIPGPPGSLVDYDVGVAGPLARGVADLRLALGVTAGPLPAAAAGWRLELDPGPELNELNGLRIATVSGAGADYLPLAADVRASLESFAARIQDAGARVQETELPVSLPKGFASWRDMTMPIFGLGLPDEQYDQMKGAEDAPGNDPGLLTAKALTSRYRSWMRARQLREQQREAWARFFADYDVVLAPVMPTAAYPHDTAGTLQDRELDIDGTAVSHTMTLAWCGAIGVVLLPVVTVPTGLTPSGLPVGVQVIGPFLSDLRLLRIAELLTEASGNAFVPPPLAR